MSRTTALEIEFSGRIQMRTLVELGVFLLLFLLAWLSGSIPTWLGVAGTVLFGGLLVLGLLGTRRIARR